MAPPVATAPATATEHEAVHLVKKNSPLVYDVNEDYQGNYRFAPIEEAQVSRAMIKR